MLRGELEDLWTPFLESKLQSTRFCVTHGLPRKVSEYVCNSGLIQVGIK